MPIPNVLVEEIRQGDVLLFLGAGASFGAEADDGREALSGQELARALSDRFLGGGFKTKSLSEIAELAISESDIVTVQYFVADLFRGLRPASHHLEVPTFRWHGIVTTNFDRVIEDAYEAQDARVQQLGVFLSDKDRVEDIVRSQDHTLLIKLHGCITRLVDESLPLIITPDQYVTHRKGRVFLFNMFQQWAREKTVVFVGQDLLDSDLREAILSLEENQGAARRRYFLVRPNLEQEEVRLWERRRIDALNMTFAQFMDELAQLIPKETRPLLAFRTGDHPIKRWFAKKAAVSSLLLESLETTYEYVYLGMPYEGSDPNRFYRGFDLGWHPIRAGLDVRRKVTDKVLLDAVLADEGEREALTELYVVKGEAGSGKSILLRRLAWEAAVDADCLVLFHKSYRSLSFAALRELSGLSEERIFLFLDNLAEHVTNMDRLFTEARRHGVRLTIIGAESHSRWEIYCQRLSDFVSNEYSLHRLSEEEIAELVDKLELHDSLGPRLGRMTRDERIKEFLNVAERHLLVALHEATLGEPFEAIIEKEFHAIKPAVAQQLYLTVCVLNRLRVPVRAGLVSRVHGIPFERFKEDLLGPLSHVVFAQKDSIVKDYLYRARHPEIADMVFRRVLADPERRFKEYMSILQEMNLAYRTDEIAFESMMKGRSVVELFPDYQMAIQVYERAEQLAPSNGELFHQRAIFEMRRPNPSTETAYKCLEKAWELGRNSPAITHTYAELSYVQAEHTESRVRKESYWRRAEELATSIVNHPFSGRHARHTLVKVGIARLKDAIDSNQGPAILEELIGNVEQHLAKGYRQNPGDNYMIASEADFQQLLERSDKAIDALERGFSRNPRDRYIASRLARAYEGERRYEQAEAVVDAALKANRSDQYLNFRKAMLLRRRGDSDRDLLLYHLRRAFTPGDDNLEAQFWYARYAYESPDTSSQVEARRIFSALRSARVPYELKTTIRDYYGGKDNPTRFRGGVARLEGTFGFIEVDALGRQVFAHSADSEEEAWSQLKRGSRVVHNIGYTLKGPIAVNLCGE